MATKWKNISKNIIIWLAVAAILVCSCIGLKEGYELYQYGLANWEENQAGSYRSFSFEDYFKNRTFEHSDTYKSYCEFILCHILQNYANTGTWVIDNDKSLTKQNQKELDVNLIGTVTYDKKSQKKQETIAVGDLFRQEDETKKNIVYLSGSAKTQQYAEEDYDGNTIGQSGETVTVNQWFFNGQLQHTKNEEETENVSNDTFSQENDLYASIDTTNQLNQKVSETTEIELWMQIPEANYASLEADWNKWMTACDTFLVTTSILLVITAAAVIILIAAVSPEHRSKFGEKYDHMWLEVQCFFGMLYLGIFIFCIAMYIEMMMDGYNRQLVNLAMAGAALCEFLIVYTCISWVRKIKESYFMKSALCYKILHKIWKKMKQQKEEWEIWRDKSDSTLNLREKEMKRKKKSLIITILSGTLLVWFVLLMAVTFEAVPFILADIVLALFLLRFFRKLWKDYQKEIQDLLDLEKVLQQIYEISNGNLMARTEIEPDSLYYKATKDLSEIGQGMAKSVEEQLKSERMKIDLITNVSHDLKTPLTSIISYVDLLSKDESLSEEAHDYVSILEKKAERLKNIVIDLFDLAKSTSGNAEVNLSIMNMEKLIEQTLIEMEDKVQESGFEIITDYNVERPLFEGDVNRMYRVVQNLLENALKYSLAGSRIYISISEEAEKLKLSIKNTASYRMKFTEEEILERFTRGDESRTTEGSGLGLSIAENFTKLCGGEFKVKIDGDQFTTEIQFAKKYEV